MMRMNLPAPNKELRGEEERQMYGDVFVVNLHLPTNDVVPIKVPISREVGYVKAMFSEQIDIPSDQIIFKFNGRIMIDPMSFSDHPGAQPPSIDVQVEFTD